MVETLDRDKKLKEDRYVSPDSIATSTKGK